jgi:hypothetical protein
LGGGLDGEESMIMIYDEIEGSQARKGILIGLLVGLGSMLMQQ